MTRPTWPGSSWRPFATSWTRCPPSQARRIAASSSLIRSGAAVVVVLATGCLPTRVCGGQVAGECVVGGLEPLLFGGVGRGVDVLPAAVRAHRAPVPAARYGRRVRRRPTPDHGRA